MARAYSRISAAIASATTPQTQPIFSREFEMVKNNAGGFGFVLDDWERLNRFLILGSESGTYYVGESKLTEQNAAMAVRCIKTDGPRAVALAYDINVNNRAPKTDQQLFVLALAMKYGDDATKQSVAKAAPDMLRTGTHLLHFASMLNDMGGWNRSKRRLISNWFTDRDADILAYQVLKYQNRDGFTMWDVLRLTHPVPLLPSQNAVLAWIANKLTTEKAVHLPDILANHTTMLNMENSTPIEQAFYGIAQGLPREALPTEAINDLAVQRAMLPTTPIGALLRNLGNLSASGLAVNGSPESALIAAKLRDARTLKKARVHPFAILLAALVYKQGRGVRGNKTWIAAPAILSALEDAYDTAFENVEPTNKRILIGVDISGSMNAPCTGTPIPSSTAASAMAITLARAEPNAVVVQFDTSVRKVMPITKRTGIASVENTTGGGTDVSAPIRWALGDNSQPSGYFRWEQTNPVAAKRQQFDAFVILTDNETWAGRAHNSEVLNRYRREVVQGARLICCAMAANHASVVDPNDVLSFGAAGLDASLPALVSDFIGK
jgi:60 kDa SS-A/Ro ribonucleoprotein